MEAETNPVVEKEGTLGHAAEILDQASAYGFIIIDSLYLIIAGMLVIFCLHKLASVVLYPRINNKRLVKVVFGTLYVLVLLVTALVALREIGFDVSVIGQITLIGVLIGAVVVFFAVPFLPRLPFVPGHMVDINGTLGTVDAISTFHTTIRQFDGTMVFLPNAIVMASRIMNYHDTPTRRIEMSFSVKPDSDLTHTMELLVLLMSANDKVVDDPAPPAVFVTSADANSVNLSAYCWVLNGDWLGARSDLWLATVERLKNDDKVTLALPGQSVQIEQTTPS